LSKPGLVVDLSRRANAERVAKCFAKVRPAGEIERGSPHSKRARYSLYAVSGPISGALASGCPL